jgi:hypothetical protein
MGYSGVLWHMVDYDKILWPTIGYCGIEWDIISSALASTLPGNHLNQQP